MLISELGKVSLDSWTIQIYKSIHFNVLYLCHYRLNLPLSNDRRKFHEEELRK